MSQCQYAAMFPNPKNNTLKCWPSTDTVEGSVYCKKHLMKQEIHADKFGYPQPPTNNNPSPNTGRRGE